MRFNTKSKFQLISWLPLILTGVKRQGKKIVSRNSINAKNENTIQWQGNQLYFHCHGNEGTCIETCYLAETKHTKAYLEGNS